MKSRMNSSNQLVEERGSSLDIQKVERPLAEISHRELVGDNDFSRRLLVRQQNFFRRIFPTELDKIAQGYEAQIAKIQADSRAESLRMLKEFQKQSLAEMFNTMLVRGKNKLRGETAIIFAESLKKLQLEVQALTDEYFDAIMEEEEEIERLTSERIKTRRFRMLERRMDEFEEAIDILMEDFKNIVNEKVNVFP